MQIYLYITNFYNSSSFLFFTDFNIENLRNQIPWTSRTIISVNIENCQNYPLSVNQHLWWTREKPRLLTKMSLAIEYSFFNILLIHFSIYHAVSYLILNYIIYLVLNYYLDIVYEKVSMEFRLTITKLTVNIRYHHGLHIVSHFVSSSIIEKWDKRSQLLIFWSSAGKKF